MNLKSEIFSILSTKAIQQAVRENADLLKMWNLSQTIFPELGNHFVGCTLKPRNVLGIRFLTCSEALFLKERIEHLQKMSESVESYLDIGDSDGSTRMLLQNSMDNFNMSTLGINLQTKAVEQVKQLGLDAECIDALDMHKTNRKYDIVSLFETLEHLTDPLGFLKSIHPVVNKRLIVSVPFIDHSRVGLAYLQEKWPEHKVPTIENTHVFELSPNDWNKIFLHCGWCVEDQKVARPFPSHGSLKHIMRYAWKKISFEGYWFVSLKKDNFDRKSRFRLE